MGVKLGEAVVYLLGDQKGIEGSLEDTEKKTTSWAKGLAGGVTKFLGGALKVGVAAAGAAIVGIGALAFSAGMTMDSAMDSLRISTGKTGAELQVLEDDFRAVFQNVPGDADRAAGAVGELNRRLGYTGETLQDVSERMLRLSDMTGGDATANAGLFARVVGDWSVSNEDAAATLDKLFVAGQQTGVGVESLMTKVVQFGSPLRLMGFTLDDSIALFAKWEKEGVNAELVMGSLRIAAGKFAADGKPLRESLLATFESIQNNTDASAALAEGMEVFGARAGPDMTAAIREGRFAIDDLAAALENSEGAILDAAAATDDFPQKLEVLKNKATVALAPVGLAVMDLASGLIDTLGPSVEQAAQWLGENLPGAIATLMTWWNEKLQPALTTVAGYIAENVVPALTEIAAWLGENVPAAVATLVGFWTGTLQPALQEIWTFVQENLTPILAGLAAMLLAIVVPAFVSWAGAAATAAAATVAALAPVVAPILAIGAAVALLVAAWKDDWGGIRTTLTQFWEETGRPIFDLVRAWLAEKIPQAIAVLKKFWEEVLLPALQAVWRFIEDKIFPTFAVVWQWLQEKIPAAVRTAADFWNTTLKPALEAVWAFIQDHVFPIFATLWAWLQENIPAAVQTLSDFWNETLLPAIKAVWAFFDEYIIPIFRDLVDIYIAALKLALGALTALWEETLLPALKAVWTFIQDTLGPILSDLADGWLAGVTTAANTLATFWRDTLLPILTDVWTFVRDNLGPILQWLKDTVIDALTGALDSLKEKLGWVKDRLNELKEALKNLKLPDWLTPGSPTPFEMGLRGITDAMAELNRVELPRLQANLAMGGAPAGGGTGAAGGSTIQHTYQITNWSPEPESRMELGHLITALELAHA